MIVNLRFDNNASKSQIDSFLSIINNRLSTFDELKPTSSIKDKDVEFKIPKLIDSAILKILFVNNGRFGLWLTYENSELHQQFNEINDVVNRLNIAYRFVNDTSQLSKQFPLYNKLQPMIDKDGYLIDGPIIGMGFQQDKLLIDSILNLKAVSDNFPRNLRFKWYFKSNNDYYPLIAIKTNNEKSALITSNMIKDVFVDTYQNNKNCVVVKLIKDYNNTFRLLTRENINRALAVTIDNDVYLIQKQTVEIDNGKLLITGNYSLEEFNLIVSLLKCGELNIKPKIINIEIEKN